MSALKSIFIIFCIGIIFGLLISPYASTKPEDLLLTPTKDLFAKESNPINLPSKSNQNGSKIDHLAVIYSQYDQEQELLLQESKVLGVNAIEEEGDQVQTKTISQVSGNKIIALFGDSMVDTMETGAPYLSKAIAALYPHIKLDVFNYGIGAQQASTGMKRLHDQLDYKDRHYKPILNSDADIFIVDSFAYNPMENIDEFESSLREILTTFKATGKDVYVLATIAPLKSDFGKGPGGVNWDKDTTWIHATKIQAHMEKAISVAQSLNIPVIDCYHPTLQSNGEGIARYVNKHDGIHPSVTGHQYLAGMIATNIDFR